MEVRRTTRQTSRQAAHVLGNAFADDPVSVAAYRNFSLDKRIQALTVDFSFELSVCLRRGYPLEAIEGGRVIAAAVIYPPGAYPLPMIVQWLIQIKSIVANGFYDFRGWIRWLNAVEKIHPTEPHFYLEYLGVEPEFQGKGYGSAVVRHLTSKADEQGVGCYLENGNPRNVVFYQRLGFETRCEKEITGIPTWFMWRPPGGREAD